MVKKQEIIGLEFIGKKIIVVDAKNKALIGIEGTIIDETKNTFEIKTKMNKTKKLIKSHIVFNTTFRGKTIQINGSLLQKRPEERIKSR